MQPLLVVLDRHFLDVPGAEFDGCADYLSSDSTGNQRFGIEKTMSINIIVTPGSSSGSGNTGVLSSKSLLIAMSDSSKDTDNSRLREVSNVSEGEDDEVDSPPRKKGATARSKAETSKNKA